MVNSWRFELVVCLAIVASCVAVGMKTEVYLGRREGWRSSLVAAEHIFTVGFTLEFWLRICLNGWARLRSMPAALDAVVILITGALPVWILPGAGVGDSWQLELLIAFRAVRIVRGVRVIQKVEALREIWLLMRGLKESLRVLCGTVVLIFFLTYVFAVFGVLFIGVRLKDAYQHASIEEQFELQEVLALTDGVSAMMSTLIQVLTLDSWNGFVRVIVKFVPASWMFFYVYIAVAVIVLMNLVTAVIVDNALKNSQRDSEDLVNERERELKNHMQHFRSLFEVMDSDGSGTLTRLEFDEAFEQPEVSNQLKLMGIGPSDCQELFSLLDSGDGVLSLEEFFQGFAKIEGTAQARDVLRLQKTVDVLVQSILRRDGLSAEKGIQALPTEKGAGALSFVFPHMSPTAPPQLPAPSCDAVDLETGFDLEGVSVCQRERERNMDLCIQKVDALFGELAELKTGLATVLQMLGCKPSDVFLPVTKL